MFANTSDKEINTKMTHPKCCKIASHKPEKLNADSAVKESELLSNCNNELLYGKKTAIQTTGKRVL